MPFERISDLKKFRQWNASQTVTFILSLVVLLIPFLEASFAQESLPEFQPTSQRIKKFGKAFNLLEFKPDGKKLKPSFEKNSNVGMQKFQTVRRAIASRSSQSSSGGSAWSSAASDKDFVIACGYGPSTQYGFVHKDQFWVYLNEHGTNTSTINVKTQTNGTISVDFTFENGSSMFRFRQQPNGLVYCQDLTGEIAFASRASSYDAFCQKNPVFIRNRLEPIFKHIGLGVPPSRYANEVVKNVLLDLKPVDDSRMKEFQSAIDDLNAQSFAEREAAMKSLEDKFDQWRDLIQSTIDDDQLSVEIRTRLKKIFETKATKKEVGDLEIVQQGKLEDDATYLIWLLGKIEADEQTASEEVKKILVARIEKLTGKKLGNDLKKWQAWVGDNQDEPKPEEMAPTISNQEILALNGTLESASKHIGRLIRLKQNEGDNLELDREHWAKTFGGKTIKELTTQVQNQIKEANLPKSWFEPGGDNSIASAGYPQVLFELIQEEHSSNQDIYSRGIRGWRRQTTDNFDRKFTGRNLAGELKFEKRGLFQFSLTEANSEKRKLFFKQNRNGTVLFNLDYPGKDALIRIVQNGDPDSENRFSVFDLRGPAVKVYRAKSFADFKNKEKKYAESLLLPLLKRFEIKISETEK